MPNGYGTILLSNDKKSLVHRVAWSLFKGPIPEDLHVLHKCDVRNCVNPYHLFLGTNLDNIHDRIAKGRSRNQNIGKTLCKNGHPLAGPNLYVRPTTKHRYCRICAKKSHDKYLAKKRL